MSLTPEYIAEFDNAVETGDLNLVKTLLAKEGGLEYVEAYQPLIPAVAFGHRDMVDLFLQIPWVRAHAADDNNEALCIAAAQGNKELINVLVAVDCVNLAMRTDSHPILRAAVVGRQPDVVKGLLNFHFVRQAIASNNHAVLSIALRSKYWDIAVTLLQHYDQNCLSEFILAQGLSVPSGFQFAGHLKEMLLNRGVTVFGRYTSTSIEAKALNQWIEHWGFAPWPAGKYITTLSWSEYLCDQAAVCADPRQAAIIILSLNAMANNRIQELAKRQVAVSGSESAMEGSELQRVIHHYNTHVKPIFTQRFDASGGLEGVERDIRASILDKIIEQAPDDVKRDIQRRKKNILSGVEADRVWARKNFCEGNNIYHTAWRAYDAGAEVVEWDSLLTAPEPEDQEKNVYTIEETGASSINLKDSSDIIRRMAADCYLVATDERLSEEQQDTALESFIAAIAEIRRAHNPTPDGIDNPSCFPGCFTRLHEVTKRNSHIPNFKLELDLALKQSYINVFVKQLTLAFGRCNEAQALCLYDSLNMMSRLNAWDLIFKSGDVYCMSSDGPYTPELLHMRQQFVAQYLPFQPLYDELKVLLFNRDQSTINTDDSVLVRALLTEVTGGHAADYVQQAYYHRVQALKVEAPNQHASATAAPLRLSVPPQQQQQQQQQQQPNPVTSNRPGHSNLR